VTWPVNCPDHILLLDLNMTTGFPMMATQGNIVTEFFFEAN